jgi:hypothetical protein
MNLEAFVTHFGYLALVVGLMIEGETMLVFGAFMAHRGYLSLPLVILTGFLVTFASDQFFFWLGRTQGSRFLEGRPPRYNSTFDPYPYILLNLFLSMLASIQAPIIMMSQNRQASKDRMDAAHDYEVNLKAEMEIEALHQKLDELREQKWADLVGMQQQEQIRLLTKLLEEKK